MVYLQKHLTDDQSKGRHANNRGRGMIPMDCILAFVSNSHLLGAP